MTVSHDIGEQARAIHARILEESAVMERHWPLLAALLTAFYDARAWEDLGHESFASWCGDPDVAMSRVDALAKIRCYRVLVIERGVDPKRLATMKFTKVRDVLSAITSGEADVDEALADCVTLSRADLLTKYGRAADISGTRAPDERLEHVRALLGATLDFYKAGNELDARITYGQAVHRATDEDPIVLQAVNEISRVGL